LERYGLLSRIGRNYLFPTIGSAVHRYVEECEVDWIDWEDQLTITTGRS